MHERGSEKRVESRAKLRRQPACGFRGYLTPMPARAYSLR
ncbi:hypothetical protein Hsw_2560 [Hymenobacter swuensis DY53]|uniref:Uncharacterized protein n=1 Tax=Hymenobacter swuensis DY53 TaxID=1227739 RepID=W8F8V3_9BACT|nr:hypothetical protein Hsw_2560 [Hymenobacter swuensis DY53]